METPIKNEGPELAIQSTPTALRISDSTPTHATRQSIPCENRTNVALDTNIWPAGEDHPYYQVSEMLEYAVGTLQDATKKRGKRSCIQALEVAWNYLKRGIILLPTFVADVQASLRTVLTRLNYEIDHGGELTLEELKVAADQAIPILEGTQQKIAELIVADEDARYPGCRNDEGELIVGGLAQHLSRSFLKSLIRSFSAATGGDRGKAARPIWNESWITPTSTGAN